MPNFFIVIYDINIDTLAVAAQHRGFELTLSYNNLKIERRQSMCPKFRR